MGTMGGGPMGPGSHASGLNPYGDNGVPPIPNLVRGEIVPQPVQVVTEPAQVVPLGLAPTPPAVKQGIPEHLPGSCPRGAHNTVQGQVCGPPRINSLRGTHLSPIIEASDASALAPMQVNTQLPVSTDAAAKRQPSPPGVVNTNNQPLQQNPSVTDTNTTAAHANPTLKQMASHTAAQITANLSDPTSLPLFPGAPMTSMDAQDGKTAPPQQIRVERDYVMAGFDADRDLVSDVSSDNKDPWNRSPNSVMSQFARDLEPNSQCCVRGTGWYDALHYMCQAICTGGGRADRRSRSRGNRRDRDRRDPRGDRDHGDYNDYQIHYKNFGRGAPGPYNNTRSSARQLPLNVNEQPQNYQQHFSRHV